MNIFTLFFTKGFVATTDPVAWSRVSGNWTSTPPGTPLKVKLAPPTYPLPIIPQHNDSTAKDIFQPNQKPSVYKMFVETITIIIFFGANEIYHNLWLTASKQNLLFLDGSTSFFIVTVSELQWAMEKRRM